MRRWQKKYFVLDSFLLRYYHDAKDIKAGAAPKGIITLSNCSVHKSGMSETFGSMKINLSDGAAGRMYCFSGPDAEDVMAWYEEIKSLIESRSHPGGNGTNPPSNGAEGLRRRHQGSGGGGNGGGGGGGNSGNMNKDVLKDDGGFVSGGEGDDEIYDDLDDDGHDHPSTRSLSIDGGGGGHHHHHGRNSSSMEGGSGGGDQVMNLLRSRGLSHGFYGRKRNKRLRSLLRAPLAESVKSLVSLYRESDAWQLLGVEDGVRVSLVKPEVASRMGLAYPTPIDMNYKGGKRSGGRAAAGKNGSSSSSSDVASGEKNGMLPIVSGVCIIKAPPSAVSRLLMDPRERGHWDPHFSSAEEVDSCFPRTQIVRLKGRLAWRRDVGSPFDEVCKRVAKRGIEYDSGGKSGGCCGGGAGERLLSVVANATVAASISGAAAYVATITGSDTTVAAVAGAAVAGAACWQSDGGSEGVGGGGGGGLGGGGRSSSGSGGLSGGGRWSVGPLSMDVESRARDRTVLAVQHLCTMGRDSDVILERSVVSNNTDYHRDEGKRGGAGGAGGAGSGRGGGAKGRSKRGEQSQRGTKIKDCVVGTVGVSGWIIEPLVVRERVVSQVTYISSLDGGGWLPKDLNASLVMERLSCLTCLRALAAQTLDTDSWGAEMDLARRPGDLWEPGAEAYWTNEETKEGTGVGIHDDSSGGSGGEESSGGGDGGGSEKKITPGVTMKQGAFDSLEPNTWARYRDPSMVVRASGYVDSSSDGYKKKVESGEPMYECVCCDIFPTEEKVSNLSDYMKSPPEIKEKEGETDGVPHTFIYNAMMPNYQAAMWGKEDGKSHNVVAWCVVLIFFYFFLFFTYTDVDFSFFSLFSLFSLFSFLSLSSLFSLSLSLSLSLSPFPLPSVQVHAVRVGKEAATWRRA